MTVVTPVRPVRRKPIIIAIAVLVGVLIVAGGSSSFYTELLWFKETGYEPIFWAGIWVRLGLGVAFGAVFAVVLLANLWIVKKITSPARLFTVPDQILERYRQTLQPYMRWAVIGGAILFGVFAGSGATVVWQDWLLFDNAVDFGQTDPVFAKDLGFYVFRLPFHRFLFTWGFSSLVVIMLITAFSHYFMGGIRLQGPGDRVSPEARAHLSVLVGLIVLLKAWGYRLDQLGLLYSERGTVTGASYTDVNAQLPALRLLVIIAVVVAVLFLVNARFKNWMLPLGGIVLLALTSIVAGGIWPALTQRLRVAPNEQVLEADFIERNLDHTRRAYGLENVTIVPHNAEPSLPEGAVDRNQQTIQNIRLWDPRIVRDNYLQLQRVKQYYDFLDVDVDRYDIDGKRQLVMLSAREVTPSGLEEGAQTWLNQHLVYTHGYGVAASRVDRVTPEGQPSFIISNIPPVSTQKAPGVEQPRIYYGEAASNDFVVVDSTQPELDFPKGDDFEPNSYEGEGGVELTNVLRRAAFAWRFRDVNLLISGAIKGDSRILMRRNVLDRISHVAPFLRLDTDPYIALVDGRLTWIADAYTTTDMFPYSERIGLGAVADRAILPGGTVNYIRNAVKFVVDAEDGTIDAYIWDEQDPVIGAWKAAFPGIFKSRSEMSPDLLAHVRYPEGMFMVQTDRYASYHITRPSNFYSREDAWRVALDPTEAGVQTPPVRPYYLMMRLPDEQAVDFVLVRPFTPRGRENLTAYMVAHSDCLAQPCPDYGRLTTLAFPKDKAILGPQQVFARINQDPIVSEQITLWSQQNSRVRYGNLVIIPIEDSLLYVQPLFLQGAASQLPELARVVVATAEEVVMAETLDQAIAALLGQAEPSRPEPEPETPGDTVAALLAQAAREFELANEALRDGDLAEFQRHYQAGARAVERANQQANPQANPQGSPSPSPTAG